VKAVRHFDTFLMTNHGWDAMGYDEQRNVKFTGYGPTKAAAIAAMKKVMMPWSIRALLCWKCNRGLGFVEKFFDATRHPDNLLTVIAYLKRRLK
jgi:hypothetical protein